MIPTSGADKADKVTVREKTGFACGACVTGTSPAALHVLINPIFNITMGLSPALLGTVSFLQTIWYTMVVPFVGQFSDAFRSKHGRRRPLIRWVSLPLAVSFALIWFFPRGFSSRLLLLYLLASSLVFLTIHAFYAVPFQALTMEATADTHERTRLNAFTQICVFVAQVFIQWIFPFTQLRLFGGVLSGVRWFAVLFGLFILGTAAVPAFLNREPLYKAVRNSPQGTLWPNIASTLTNRPFLIITAIRTVFTFSYNIVGVLGLYLNYYYVFGGNIRSAAIQQSWNGTVFQVAAICSIFYFRRFAINNGKGAAIRRSAAILIVGSVGKLFLYVPGMPWLQLFIYVANGAAGAASVLLSNAALADIADYDEFRSGMRREGVYASVLGWFDRVGNSVGTLISGFVLVWIGFDVHAGGHQSPATLKLMQMLYFGFPFLGACSAIWLARYYSLDADRCGRLRKVIESRRILREFAAAPAK